MTPHAIMRSVRTSDSDCSMTSLPARTALLGKMLSDPSVLQRHELSAIISPINLGGAQASIWAELWGESHAPEVVQGLRRVNSNLPKIVILGFFNPYHAKSGGLLRKTVRNLDLRALL